MQVSKDKANVQSKPEVIHDFQKSLFSGALARRRHQAGAVKGDRVYQCPKAKNSLSWQTCVIRAAKLKHFYEMNDITLNWKKINHFIGEKARTIRDRAYTKEEIRRMLDNLNKMLDSFMEEEKMIRRERKRRNDHHQMLCWQAMEANGRDQVTRQL
jgi:hypothetical protein